MTRRLLVVLFGISLLFLSSRPVSAAENESFGIAPHPPKVDGKDRASFAIPLERGAMFEDTVRIYNRTDQTLTLVAYAADAEAAPDGTISVDFRTSRPKGVGSWIDLSREDIELPPRDEALVSFRVSVKSENPSPRLGAIVVENTASGIAANAAQRLTVNVRTTLANTPTTSDRVRPLMLRSPWVIVAIFGLVAAALLVFIGARRARRPKDVVVSAGELEPRDDQPEAVPVGSLPVIKHLGAAEPGTERLTVRTRARSLASDERPLLDDGLLVEIDEAEVNGERRSTSDGDVTSVDLPPARGRAKKPARSQSSRTPARTNNNSGKTAARRNSNSKTTARKTTAKPTAKRKAATSAAKKNGARKRPARARQEAPPNYIPLDDL